MISRMLDELGLNVDAHLPELLLHQRQHFGVEKGFADEVVLDGEAIGMSGFSEQFFGFVGIVLRQFHRYMPEVARRQGAESQIRQGPGIQRVFDGLPVDSVYKSLTHLDIIEGRLGHVDIDAFLSTRTAFVEHRTNFLDLFLKISRYDLGIQDVKGPFLEADELGSILRYVKPVHLIDLRTPKIILVVGFEDNFFTWQVFVKIEWASPNRVPAKLITRLLGGFFADNVSMLIAHHAQQKYRIIGLQRDLHRVGVNNRDLLDHIQILRKEHAFRALDLALEAELHILCRHLPKALVELHAFAQLERPHSAII